MATPKRRTLMRSRPTPSTSNSSAHQVPALELPPYQAPVIPLTPSAMTHISSLATGNPLSRLKSHTTTAANTLTELAGELLDRQTMREDIARRKRERLAKQGQNTADGDDEEVQKRRDRVEEAVRKCDLGVRGCVDVENGMHFYLEALKETAAKVMEGAHNARGSQMMAGTQRAPRRRVRRGMIEDEDDPEGEGESMGEEEEVVDEESGPGPHQMLEERLDREHNKWEQMSLRNKYATDNAYIDFRRTLHDARYPGEAPPPMPHADTWFPASPEPPTVTDPSQQVAQSHASLDPLSAPPTQSQHPMLAQQGTAGDEDDEELVITSNKQSLKCPITLQFFVHPLQSKNCPHSFEAEAILAMVRTSNLTSGGNGRRAPKERAVQCPVCEVMITESGLERDRVLERMVRRAMERQGEEREEDEEEVDPPSDEEVVRVSGSKRTGRKIEVVKREKRNSRRRIAGDGVQQDDAEGEADSQVDEE